MDEHLGLSKLLQERGIQPSAQRVAIARFVLRTDGHPTADEVLAEVRLVFPMVSRATVYNTLRLFAEKGLLRTCQFEGGVTVYDPNTDRHHHLIDEESGRIIDVPWDALEVRGIEGLDGFAVDSWMVVVRGRRRDGGASR
ncbi:MAG: Fur family transcriptional regulator [Candidatus Krumholzibacteriia bacterium]